MNKKQEILNQVATILANLQQDEQDSETKIALFDLSRNIGTYAKYYDELNPIIAREMNRVAQQNKWNELKVTMVDDINIGYEVTPKIFEIKDNEREERE
jgi:hypothetical protein